MSNKAGIVHLHVGDGERGLSPVRDAIRMTELPPSVFHPTHVNRRRRLFDEACDLAREGITIDITAFPVAADEDAWPADEALVRYLDAGLPPGLVTVSSDAGGCLPVFDDDGRVTAMDVGQPSALATTLKRLLDRGSELARVLPAFTSNVARLLRFRTKGHLAAGADADLVVLSPEGIVHDVMAGGVWMVRGGEPVVRGAFEGVSR